MMTSAHVALVGLCVALAATHVQAARPTIAVAHRGAGTETVAAATRHDAKPALPDQAVAVGLLRGGAAAPSRAAAAPCAAAFAAHGLFFATAGYGAGFFGAATGTALVACAAATVAGGYKSYMIGVHSALLLQLLAGGVYGFQACRACFVPAMHGELSHYATLVASSVGALFAEMKLKPKKGKPPA